MVKRQGIEEKEEEEYVKPRPETKTSRPLFSILTEPINLLNVDKITQKGAFKSLSGRWSYVKARKSTPLAGREYSVKAGPFGSVADANLYIYQDGNYVKTLTADKDGKASMDLAVTKPMFSNYKVSLIPPEAQSAPFFSLPFTQNFPLPVNFTLEDSFVYSVWTLKVSIKNKTDRWSRFAGRDLAGNLPRGFYSSSYGGRYSIGLGSPYGTQTFVDIIPLFGDTETKIVYGISAMCNTRAGHPTAQECLAARPKTWWKFTVEGFNGLPQKPVSGDLNIDRHLELTLKPNSISGRVIKPVGAQT